MSTEYMGRVKRFHTKDLVKKATYREADRYCIEHPPYRLPTPTEAEELDTEHDKFWVAGSLGDRRVVYVKNKQCYERAHPNFQINVVVVKETEQ